MQNWCIVQLPSTVQLKDDVSVREWTVTLSKDVAPATIIIVEKKFCDGELRAETAEEHP